MKEKGCSYGANIYDRQERVKGWKQRKLKKAKVSIIGCDYISQFLLGAFTGLGIGDERENGHTIIYGDGKLSNEEKLNSPFYLEADEGEEKVRALENICKRINPSLAIKGINWVFSEKELEIFLGKEDLIIEATNDMETKEMLIDFSNKMKKPFISASCDKNRVKIFFNHLSQGSSSDFEIFENKRQNLITGELTAGIISEEVRKFFNPLKTDLAYKEREFEFDLFENSPDIPEVKDSNLLIAGFGTGGCWEAPVYASLGVGKMEIVDPDYVETTNLNRQWLFYCSVGKWKVDVGKKRLKLINPNLKVNKHRKRFEDLGNSVLKNVDVIVEGVDNFETRYKILKKSLELKIPYVSSGVTFDAGRVVTTYPGKTSSLEEVLGISKLIRIKKASCSWERNPSIVTTNMVVSALSISETLKVLDERYGEPFSGIIRYESNSKKKIFYNKAEKI
ncbi:MAG: ThiF family adenylyltransferase [Candidatus Aenigmatarchaeota archaeon]